MKIFYLVCIVFITLHNIAIAQIEPDPKGFKNAGIELKNGYEIHYFEKINVNGGKETIRIYYELDKENNRTLIRKKRFNNRSITSDEQVDKGISRQFIYDEKGRIKEVSVTETVDTKNEDGLINDPLAGFYKVKYERNQEGKIVRIYKENESSSILGNEPNQTTILEYDEKNKKIKKGVDYERFIDFLDVSEFSTGLVNETKDAKKRKALMELGIIKVVIDRVQVREEKGKLTRKRSLDNRRYLVFDRKEGKLLGEAFWSENFLEWTTDVVYSKDIWMLVPQKIVNKIVTTTINGQKKSFKYGAVDEGYIVKAMLDKPKQWEVYDNDDKLLYEVTILSNDTISAVIAKQDKYDFSDATEPDIVFPGMVLTPLEKKQLEKFQDIVDEIIDIEENYREFTQEKQKQENKGKKK